MRCLTVFPALLLVPERLWLGRLPAPAGGMTAFGGARAARARWPRPVLLSSVVLFALAMPFMLRADLGRSF